MQDSNGPKIRLHMALMLDYTGHSHSVLVGDNWWFSHSGHIRCIIECVYKGPLRNLWQTWLSGPQVS